MRVIFYCHTSSGGTDRYFGTLQSWLALSGCEASCYVEPSGRELSSLVWRSKMVRQIVDVQSDFDLVFASAFTGGMLPRLKIPVIVVPFHHFSREYLERYCGLAERFYNDVLMKGYALRSYRRATRIVAISESTKRSVIEDIGVPSNKVSVVYPGVDLNKFHCTGVIKGSKMKDKIRMLFVGSLIKRKGVDLLPEILDGLPENYILNYVSGRDHSKKIDHPRAFRIEALSDDKLVEAYRECDFLLFPTRLEGFGYAVAEAMACGKPVVSTRVSSIPELVDDNKGGLLCNIDDVGSFVAAARKLGGDLKLRQKMGEYNKQRVVAFGHVKQVSRLTDIFRTVIEERKNASKN